jgi:hypothetical protein
VAVVDVVFQPARQVLQVNLDVRREMFHDAVESPAM